MRHKASLVILMILPILLLSMTLVVVNGPGIIDLNDLFDYSNQPIPGYIQKDNTPFNNTLTDEGATLGRVLFYDKQLSVDNTVSCASCHQQQFAFGDTAVVSQGVNGTTGRHSVRLVNARFGDEVRFFWDERAASLGRAKQPNRSRTMEKWDGVVKMAIRTWMI